MEKETIEEAKLNFCNNSNNFQGISREDLKIGWDACAKWMQERSYSEEDMINFAWFLVKNLGQYSDDKLAHFDGMYLKQFKNQTR
jgi:hypothetical protein